MKHCVVEDSSFVVATIDKSDPFHKDAVFVFQKLLLKKDKIKIVLPPLALYEIIVTLSRKGIPHDKIEATIMRFLHIDHVVVTSVTEASAFKHCKTFLNNTAQTSALRTADFLITSLAVDFDAQILTFDKKLWQKVKPLYNKTYYCSSVGGMTDETSKFLLDLDNATP